MQLGTVIALTALDVNLSLILDSMFGNFLDDIRFGGLCNLTAKDDFTNLLRGKYLVNTRVAVNLHLQFNHSAKICRHHKVRAVFLGKSGGILRGDATLAFADQFSNLLAEVCIKHAVVVVQVVQFQAVQNAYIDGHCCHDVLDEHVRLVTVMPFRIRKRRVIAVILATANGFAVVNGVLGLRMPKFLKRIPAEDVHRRVMASLCADYWSIRCFSSPETVHVDDRRG